MQEQTLMNIGTLHWRMTHGHCPPLGKGNCQKQTHARANALIWRTSKSKHMQERTLMNKGTHHWRMTHGHCPPLGIENFQKQTHARANNNQCTWTLPAFSNREPTRINENQREPTRMNENQ